MAKNPLSNPAPSRQAEQLLSEGQTEALLELLSQYDTPEVALLKSRFDQAKAHFPARRINFET